MRPLYLTEDYVKAIELEDSALKIRAHQKADTWYPLNRLSRIIVMGNMQWSSAALSACMKNGIPVSFSNTGGQYYGIALGDNQRPENLQQDILEYFSFEQGRYLLDNWFQAQHNHMITKLRKRFHLDTSHNNAQNTQHKLDELICIKHGYIYWRASLERLIPMLATHQALLMQSYGFDLSIMRSTQMPGLHTQMIKLLEWELWKLAANGHIPKSSLNKHIARYYERHQHKIEQRSLYWMGKLWKRMNELHYESIE